MYGMQLRMPIDWKIMVKTDAPLAKKFITDMQEALHRACENILKAQEAQKANQINTIKATNLRKEILCYSTTKTLGHLMTLPNLDYDLLDPSRLSSKCHQTTLNW